MVNPQAHTPHKQTYLSTNPAVHSRELTHDLLITSPTP